MTTQFRNIKYVDGSVITAKRSNGMEYRLLTCPCCGIYYVDVNHKGEPYVIRGGWVDALPGETLYGCARCKFDGCDCDEDGLLLWMTKESKLGNKKEGDK